ncbi:hypothetical protein BDB01DRAFT_546036 [Pilobolus umbonatus]|nr:hypothetical protein BDB01DRAFT_546036 [Pilobolus umbonatus]
MADTSIPLQIDDSPFVRHIRKSPEWQYYNPKARRYYLCSTLFPVTETPVSSIDWHKFWSLAITPESRSLWLSNYSR